MTTAISDAREKLESCVSRIAGGPWRFIQLRGEPLGTGSIDGDDVDLLGTRGSVEELTLAAFGWARAGECHFRVVSRDRYKTCLSLISIDGIHRLDLDLWIELWQIDNRTRCLRYQDCEPHLADSASAILRFPPPVEAAVYVHHLVSKKKDVTGESARKRLEYYIAECSLNEEQDLADALDEIRKGGKIEPQDLAYFDALIAPMRKDPGNRFLTKITSKITTSCLSGPRRISLISLIGCDGAGKTTLAHRLKEDDPSIRGVLTGKHLYRKSWLYKLSVIFIRPLLFQSREKYDETLAPLVYLRACLGLQIKLWKHRRNLRLIDRSISDFLMVDRKSDVPRWSRFHWLSDIFGRRIPVIHCVLPYARVIERKQEVTEAGHEAYDMGMFLDLSRRVPTDYVVFNNSGGLDESAAAAAAIIDRMQGSA